MQRIDLSLSEEQFRELLINFFIGSWIRESVTDLYDESIEQSRELEKFLLNIAKEKDLDELFEEFEGDLIPSIILSREVENAMNDFAESEFWHNLAMNLGKRDFLRKASKEDRSIIEKTQCFPNKVNEFYQKYKNEFDQYGLDRLEINEDK